jgi:hypothetical protein
MYNIIIHIGNKIDKNNTSYKTDEISTFTTLMTRKIKVTLK